jgi:hypothetical protein
MGHLKLRPFHSSFNLEVLGLLGVVGNVEVVCCCFCWLCCYCLWSLTLLWVWILFWLLLKQLVLLWLFKQLLGIVGSVEAFASDLLLVW